MDTLVTKLKRRESCSIGNWRSLFFAFLPFFMEVKSINLFDFNKKNGYSSIER